MLSSRQIIITDYCDPSLIDGLTTMGFHVDYHPEILPAELDTVIGEYEGIVVNTKIRMDVNRILKAKKLQFICRLGSGLDNIDVAYCTSHLIKVISSPEGNRQAVAEHALGMLLSLLDKLAQGMEEVRTGRWDRESVRGRELSGLKFGIIGFGNNGSAMSEVLAGFDLDIYIYDKYKSLNLTDQCFSRRHSSTLEELLQQSDIISFHVPLTPETANWLNDAFVNKCKDGVILINTSRGGIADLGSIIRGIQNQKIAGACLDVFTNEKPATYTEDDRRMMSQLSEMPQVVMTPHVAGWTVESKIKISKTLLGKVQYIISNPTENQYFY